MRSFFHRRHEPLTDGATALAPIEPEIDLNAPENVLGTQPCSGLRCEETTGVRCGYVDRRGRRCPTAWCPRHRLIVSAVQYCAVHANTIAGIEWEFGSSPHPDIENRIPAVVNWIARAAEDDVVATMQNVCAVLGEVLVSDPVRFVLVGPSRIRTWERVWKTCSPVGVSCRVAISLEEAHPDEVLIKVNSHVVKVVPTPWDLALRQPGADTLEMFFREVVMPISFALDHWQQGNVIGLRGRAYGL